MTNAQASRRKEEEKKIIASPPPRKACTVRVKRGENPNLAWKKKKEKEEKKKGKNAKKKADDFAAVMEAAFAWHDHSPEWTENAELNEHRKAVERLLSVEEQVVEATDLQPESFFELAFDGE